MQMPSLNNFKDLRKTLRAALVSREVMLNAALPLARRDLATEAYGKGVDHIVVLLERLEYHNVSPRGTRPTFAVLEDVLTAIDQSERLMAGGGHGTSN